MGTLYKVSLILLLIAPCCWTQTPTQYVMQIPSLLVLENAGTAEVCISRTGDDTSSTQNVFLSTTDDSAVGGQDFNALTSTTLQFGPNDLNECIGIVITDDTMQEFKERFTVSIVGASDGMAGSQPSTQITIEENDYCTNIPFTVSTQVAPFTFYVTPWTPSPGAEIVFQNTIQAGHSLELLFSTSSTSLSDYYRLYFEAGAFLNGEFNSYRGGTLDVTSSLDGNDFLDGGNMETITITYDQTTGTFKVVYSRNPNDVRTLIDTNPTPLAIRHIFARVSHSPAGNTFSICGNFPVQLTRISAAHSGTLSTLPTAVALNVIDNNRARLDNGGTCSVTENVEDPWLRVDLGKDYDVSAVNIYPVGHVDSNSLDDDDIANAQVWVGSCDETRITDMKMCDSAPSDIVPDGTLNSPRFPTYIQCRGSNTYGRYVYIRLETAPGVMDTLPVCEVDVFGNQIPFGDETTISFTNPSSTETFAETDTMASVMLQLNGPGSTCSSVDVYTVDDTAVSTGPNPDQMDFTAISLAAPTTVTFDPTTTMRSVNIPINNDAVCEQPESFKIALNNNMAAIMGISEKTILITDDDSTQFSIVNANNGFEITEGENPIAISVQRTANANVLQEPADIVFVSEESGNAAMQTAMFEAGKMTSEVSLSTPDDNIFEEPTTFNIRLQDQGTCDTLLSGGEEATVRVMDDDSRFYFDSDELDNGVISIPENMATKQIKVLRDGTLRRKTVDISIQRSASGSSALSGTDFTLVTSPVVFEAGRNEAFATINIEDDNIREPNERFDLVLADQDNISGNIKDPYRVTVEIADDDAVYRLESTYYSVFEAQRSVEICLERDGSLQQAKTIVLEIRDESTTVNEDYTIPSTGIAVFFAQNMPRACQSIQINADSITEGTETLLISIPTGVVNTDYDMHASLDILDDRDILISFSALEYVADEGDEKATVYVNKHGDLQQTVFVEITTTSLTAEQDDYVSVQDGIRIPAGQATASYEIRIIDDSKDESNEQFRVTLSNAGGGVISTQGGVAVVTIRDNDDQQTDVTETNNLSGGVLAGIIAGAVGTAIISALGIGLCCVYLVQRQRAPMIQARPAPQMTAYVRPYRQPFYSGGQPGGYNS